MAQDPWCSTPHKPNQFAASLPQCSMTPVTCHTPKKSVNLEKCFICPETSRGHLRKVCVGVSSPETSEVLSSIKNCFGIDTLPDSIWKFKICVRCKKTLNNSVDFKALIKTGLAESSVEDKENDPPRYKRMANSVPTPTKNTQKKRQNHSKVCRTPVKDSQKQTGRKPKQSKCSLSFGESYHTASNSPNTSVSSATTSSDLSYGQSDTSQESLKNISRLSVLRFYDTSSASFVEEERQSLQEVINDPRSSCKDVANVIIHNKKLKFAVENALLSQINVTCMQLCSKTYEPGPSVLRTLQDPNHLAKEDILTKAVLELQSATPFVYDVFRTVACSPDSDRPNTDSIVGTMYGIAMHNRNKDLSAVQKVNTAVALRYHANNDLLAVSNKCGITLAPGTKYQFLDALGKFNLAGLVKSIRDGRPGKLTVDNIDGMIVANQIRLSGGNQHYHYTASTYYPDRVDTSHLSNEFPLVAEIPLSKFYLSLPEETSLKEMYGYMVCTSVNCCFP